MPKARTRTRARNSEEILSWLSRRQTAAVLGLSEAQVQTMHGRQFHPVSAPDRSLRYSPNEVAALAASGGSDGLVSAQVFALFKKGLELTDVVIETKQTPARVRALRAEYDEMITGAVIPPTVAEKLQAILGEKATRTWDTLIAALTDALERRYQAGFREGREDATDFGEVVDPQTGERRRVTRNRSA